MSIRVFRVIKTVSIAVSACLFLSCLNPIGIGDKETDKVQWEEYKYAWMALSSLLIYQDSLPEDPYSYDTPYELYQSVNDPYTFYYPPEYAAEFLKLLTTETTGMGVLLDSTYNGYVIKEVIPESPAEEAGVIEGDTLVSIDSVETRGKDLTELDSIIEGTPGETRELRILRDSGQTVIVVTLDTYLAPSVVTDSIDPSTAEISLMLFSDSTTHDKGSYGEMKQALEEFSWADNIILDLRNNLGGDLAQCVDIISMFVPESTQIVRVKDRVYDSSSETYKTTDTLMFSHKEDINVTSNLYILINESTASASELLVSCMMEQRSENTSVIGTTTYGKGCGQAIVQTPLEGLSRITSMLIDPVNSPSYHMTGIEPDIPLSSDEDAYNVAVESIEESSGTAKTLARGRRSSVLQREIESLQSSISSSELLPGVYIRKKLPTP